MALGCLEIGQGVFVRRQQNVGGRAVVVGVAGDDEGHGSNGEGEEARQAKYEVKEDIPDGSVAGCGRGQRCGQGKLCGRSEEYRHARGMDCRKSYHGREGSKWSGDGEDD